MELIKLIEKRFEKYSVKIKVCKNPIEIFRLICGGIMEKNTSHQ